MSEVTAARAWALRRAGGVPFVASPAFDGHPWLAHGVSVLWEGDPRRTGAPLRAALGVDAAPRACLDQVHGARVVTIRDEAVASARRPLRPGKSVSLGPGDALATDRPGVALEVRVADCVPVFAVDPERRAVGLAHAGWRGTLAGVARALVASMADAFASRPADLRVWIGPSIGPECFEVGPEVAAPFRDTFGERVLSGADRVDLWEANRIDLARVGVAPEAIAVSRLCTRCRGDLFHSFRGSGGLPGRNLALVAILDGGGR